MKNKKYIFSGILVLLFLLFIASGKAGEIIQVYVGGGQLEVLTINYTYHNVTTFQYNNSADSDLNMNGMSVINADWFNGTNIDSSLICLSGDCQNSWPTADSIGVGWSTNGYNLFNNTNGIKVGINTSNPVQTFEVVGSGNFTGNLYTGYPIFEAGILLSSKYIQLDNITLNGLLAQINSTWNETRANSLFALIGAGGNTSWNESILDTLFVPYTGAISSVDLGLWGLNASDLYIYNTLSLEGAEGTGFAVINYAGTDEISLDLPTVGGRLALYNEILDLTFPYFINMTNTSWIYPLTNALYYNMTNNTFNYMQNTTLQTVGNWSWIYPLTNALYINMTNTSWALTQASANTQFMNMSNQSITANNSIFLNGQASSFYKNITYNSTYEYQYNATLNTNHTLLAINYANKQFINMTNSSIQTTTNTSVQFTQNSSVLTNLAVYTGWFNISNINISNNGNFCIGGSCVTSWFNYTTPAINYGNQFHYNMTNNTFNYMINQTLQTTLNNTWAVLAGNSTLQLTTNSSWAIANTNTTIGANTIYRAGNATNNATWNTTGCYRIQGNSSSWTIC